MNATIKELGIYCAESGPKDAPPVVLIHGFPFSHEMWAPQIEALQRDWRVVAYDVRGHGKSDAGDGQYTMELFVDDFIGVLDHLNIQQAAVCGLSMGGYIALRAMERNPERFSALVLCDTRSEADPNEGKLKRADGIKAVKQKGVPAFAEGFLKAVFAPQTFEKNPNAVNRIRNIILSNPPLGICGSLLALATRTDTTAALEKINVPTLIMVGEQDTLTPPAASQEMHMKIAGSQLKIIPGAAHMSNLENPDAFNKHLLDFLGALK